MYIIVYKYKPALLLINYNILFFINGYDAKKLHKKNKQIYILQDYRKIRWRNSLSHFAKSGNKR